MELSRCTYGRMVMTKEGHIGFIEGVTCLSPESWYIDASAEERIRNTIPLVRFIYGVTGIHPDELIPFE